MLSTNCIIDLCSVCVVAVVVVLVLGCGADCGDNPVLGPATDDDSVIIGSWFEEPSTPGDGGDDPTTGAGQGNSDSSSSPDDSQAKTPHRHNSEVTTIVPEKGEPHGVSALQHFQPFSLAGKTCMYTELLWS